VRTIGGWLWTAATVAIRFLLAFSPFASAHDPQRALGLDHRDALAVDRADEYLPIGRLDRLAYASGVEAVEVDRCLPDELLGGALGNRCPGDLANQRDRLVNGPQMTVLISRRWHS